ncbi:DUF1493 family protein [Flavobacterium olei]|uniref:DUF1493 family protein n=1 Tax=Flavobacterium olei TaxID=1886782 RepID=UPI0032195D79
MTEQEKELLDFIKSYTGLKNIDLDTNIGHENYKIFDLDAENLMNAFFKKYAIDCSNFNILNYFIYPEYSWKSLIFIRVFFKKVIYPIKAELKVKHLAEVIKKGKWFDPA